MWSLQFFLWLTLCMPTTWKAAFLPFFPNHVYLLCPGVKCNALPLFVLREEASLCLKSRWLHYCASVSMRRANCGELRGSSSCLLGSFTLSCIDYSVHHVIRPQWSKWESNRKEEEVGVGVLAEKSHFLYATSIKEEKKTRLYDIAADLLQNFHLRLFQPCRVKAAWWNV